MAKIADVAQRLLRAYESQTPIQPVRDEINGTSEAYAVQRETVKYWTKAGRRIAGRKIGLTSKAVQAQLGVDEPDFGALFPDMILPDSSEIPAAAVLQPRVEAEVAFVLSKDLVGEKITPEEVLSATDYVTPAIEVCGSRITRWDIKIEDTIADNASAGRVVVGSKKIFRPSFEMLAAVSMILRLDGKPVAEGRGAACLGNPAIAVAWLAQALTRFGERLRAGDLVMSGALAKMIPAEPGNRFHADFGDFGAVSVSFSG